MQSLITLEGAWELAGAWWDIDRDRLAPTLATIRQDMGRGGYHDLSHIQRILDIYNKYNNITKQAPSPRLLSWIFAHDIVYVPGASDNETKSADRINHLLLVADAGKRIQHDDRLAIESTKTHMPVDLTELEDARLLEQIYLLHDLDLEILAATVEDFEAYRCGVYMEYFRASADPDSFDQLWRQGRVAFLESMLNREAIYKTPLFTMLESYARSNMKREIDQIVENRP